MATNSREYETDGDSLVLQHRAGGARDYVIVSRAVLVGYPELSDGAKLTYWIIYSHDWYEPARGRRKGYVFPTVGRLARLRRTTPRTIQRHLAELIGQRLLTRVVRKGKPSVLYIEEPGEAESRRYREERGRDDIPVGGGATKMSPLKEQEEKQTKHVNGVDKTRMEEGRGTGGGMKPIGAILAPKAPRRKLAPADARRRWVASQVVEATGDGKSLGCYLAIAQRCPEGLIFEALSLLKEARRDGAITKSRGALFVGIVRRLCRERGMSDPLGRAAR